MRIKDSKCPSGYLEPETVPLSDAVPADPIVSLPLGDDISQEQPARSLQFDLPVVTEPKKSADSGDYEQHVTSESEEKPAKSGLLRVSFNRNGTSKKSQYSLLGLKKKKPDSHRPPEIVLPSEEDRKMFGGNLSLFKKLQRLKPKINSPTEIFQEVMAISSNTDNDIELDLTPPLELPVPESVSEEGKLSPNHDFRPSYHRSVSFQSRNDDDRRTLSSVSSISVSSDDEGKTTVNLGDGITDETTPKRIRQRSKTVDASDHYKTRSNNQDISFTLTKSNEIQQPETGEITHVTPPKPPSSMFSTLTNFVRARRSSSILALDEITKLVDHPTSMGHSPWENNPHSLDSHETPTTPSFTDYFSHRSRSSTTNLHKSTYSLNSLEKFAFLAPHLDEDHVSYINRLIITSHTTEVLLLICTKESDFNTQCLEYYTHFYNFHDEPLDISLRKFLMFNELPKETQQIDRVLHLFSKEYCLQNPLTNLSIDLCFILTFSLLILHTDHFNPNNKRKMNKLQFVSIVKESLQAHLENASETEKNEFTVKNVITRDVLGYYYDNITYTPFKKLEECSKELLLKVNGNKGADILKTDDDNSLEIDIASQTSIIFSRANLSNSSLTPGLIPRKRASSFFVPSSAGSDGIYDYVLGIKDKQDLRLKYSFQRRNPYISILNGVTESSIQLPYESEEDNILIETEDRMDEVHPEIFHKLITTLLSSRPEMILQLKNSRASYLKGNSKVEIISGDLDGTSFMTRVFKMGTIYRQEQKKLTSATSWRPYLVLLTSMGLIFYKEANFLKITKIEDSQDGGYTLLDESLNTGFFDSSADSGFVINKHGLFASRLESDDTKKNGTTLHLQLETFKFTIYGKNSRDTYSVQSNEEMVDWIFNINYLVALNDCYLNTEPKEISYPGLITVAEIRSSCTMKLLQKVNKSNKVLISSLDLLKKLFGVCNNFELLMPFHNKTKELLIYSLKLLNTRINWCWFELNKNLFMVKVLLYAIDNLEGVDQHHSEPIMPYTQSLINNESLFGVEGANSLISEKAAVASVLLVLNYDVDRSFSFPDSDSLGLDSVEESEHLDESTLYYDCFDDE